MEKERNDIKLNFSAENIMAYEDAVSKNGKAYRKVWIRIPDGNPLDDSSKRVFWIPDFMVNEDRFDNTRRFAYLDPERLLAVYVARGLGESFEIDLELQHLSPAEDIAEKFRQYDRKRNSEAKRRFEAVKPINNQEEKE